MKLLFKKILVANRGEIAIRIFRAATELNIRTVSVYTYEDRFSLHRYKADEAYLLGKAGNPLGHYLDHEKLIDIAVQNGVEAIHPGYGFLSENAEFARKCAAAGVKFIGPTPEILDTFGNKVSAKKAAKEAGLNIIPGTVEPVNTEDAAIKAAREIGFPLTIKASSGGGGKGIRMVSDESDFLEEYRRARSEAQKSFGNDAVYLEKTIVNPKHIEVQILGDEYGEIVHLYERDCSIQRRNQKVVEVAPALGISQETRQSILDQSVKIAKELNYSGLGTVEFLIDENDEAFFLEVNPRLQVEHTVTEMITGIDLVQASILIASGKKLSHPALAINNQNDIKPRGFAIQCRVTTEDPTNDFIPSTGKITAYRAAAGFGIRLDEGLGTTGGEVTPYYDSLLVKLTSWGFDQHAAAHKMLRSLSEFRLRGVKHNIALLKNIVSHPVFLDSSMRTSFLRDYRELYEFPKPKDRATKFLKYIAEVSVNNIHELPTDIEIKCEEPELPDREEFIANRTNSLTAKQVFDKEGAQGLRKWILSQEQLLITDTTMRDAHQSLFATRLRSRDIYRIAPFYSDFLPNLFSLEVWGGATFDTSLRFLKEDPWERLAKIREKIPNVLLQMLFRGNNAVGYTHYPKWVIKDFIRLSVEAGLDLFRIFDSLNNLDQMQLAIEEVKKNGAIAEACICYSGDISNPEKTKFTLDYYLKKAEELVASGIDILCIKDMAGLLRPRAAQILFGEIKNKFDFPVHFHTHDTSGNGVATAIAAADAGCDIIDGAISSMSGLTSQPSLNAINAALSADKRYPGLNANNLDIISRYWLGVRKMYSAFDPGLNATTTEVYQHEIPGGQYSNLYDQARKVGLKTSEFTELTNRYKEVNQLLGDIIKVTPSSKVVGDFALLLQKNHLTGPRYITEKPDLDYPDSVVSFFKGHIGEPFGGFPEDVRQLVLGKNPPPPAKPVVKEDDNIDIVKEQLRDTLKLKEVSDREAVSYRLYPKVYMDFHDHKELYGRTENLPTPAFFYGLKSNQEIEVDIEPGKTLYISLRGISDTNKLGNKTIFYNLNGFPREVVVVDKSSNEAVSKKPKADSKNEGHIPAPMPGKVFEIKVKEGDAVSQNQILMITESMKMEYMIKAKKPGKIGRIHVQIGDIIEDGDLLLEIN